MKLLVDKDIEGLIVNNVLQRSTRYHRCFVCRVQSDA